MQWAGEALSEIRGMEVYWQNFSVRAPVASASEVKDRSLDTTHMYGFSCCRMGSCKVAMSMAFGEQVGQPQLRLWC